MPHVCPDPGAGSDLSRSIPWREESAGNSYSLLSTDTQFDTYWRGIKDSHVIIIKTLHIPYLIWRHAHRIPNRTHKNSSSRTCGFRWKAGRLMDWYLVKLRLPGLQKLVRHLPWGCWCDHWLPGQKGANIARHWFFNRSQKSRSLYKILHFLNSDNWLKILGRIVWWVKS